MSKLRNHRGRSKGDFVNTALDIQLETLNFLSRLSARYARLLAKDTMQLANKIVVEAESAQSMQPTDETRYEHRKGHLLEARAAVKSLDDMLELIYQTLMKNPEGAFDDLRAQKKAKAKAVDPRDAGKQKEKAEEAIKRLDKMSETLGCLIDDEDNMLTELMDSDRRRFKSEQKKTKPS